MLLDHDADPRQLDKSITYTIKIQNIFDSYFKNICTCCIAYWHTHIFGEYPHTGWDNITNWNKKIISIHSNPEEIDSHCKAVLRWAIIAGNTPAAKFIIDQGIDCNFMNDISNFRYYNW